MRWGLCGSAGMINARAETLEQKRAFKSLLNQQRCIFGIDGFYEWERSLRQPYLISLKDDAPYALAGLWAEHMTPQEVYPTFTVITTAANTLVAPLHDRMPVMLDAEGVKAWLSDSPFDTVRALLQPYSAERMKTVAVSKKVNSVRNTGPECAVPLAGPASLFD